MWILIKYQYKICIKIEFGLNVEREKYSSILK